MKKIFITLILIMASTLGAVAQDTNLTFLYINGSNNNDTKMKDWYIRGVNKLHPVMKKKFEKNSTIKKWSKDNTLVIEEKPQIFFRARPITAHSHCSSHPKAPVPAPTAAYIRAYSQGNCRPAE